jgi:acyl-CoA dehydrogenase
MTMIDVRGAQVFALDVGKTGLSENERGDFAAKAERVAAIAATHAAEVDSASRFPAEAIDAARQEGLLGMMVPRDLGGEGASLGEVMDVCYKLGRACSSTAMIFAMHQTKVACVVRHGRGNPWHERMLRRLTT